MRKELELIEQIERYLQGHLSADEKALFEKQMAGDASLREAVTLQREVMSGIERTALKQQIKVAGKRFKTVRRITHWGLPGLGVIIVLAALFYYYGQHRMHSSSSAAEYNNAMEESQVTDADKHLPSQAFSIESSKDTVIETKGGLVLSVPANGFLDDNGQPVQGRVSLTIKEALDAASIIKAGLSTVSGSQLLESGGMFSIDARQEGKLVKINPANAIYSELPARPFKPGMQLYSGKRLPNGSIDWVNPVALERELVPMDISKLDFYPPRYLDTIGSMGYDNRDKGFTDSLYYSFAAAFAASPAQMPDTNSGRYDEQAPKGDTSISSKPDARPDVSYLPKDTTSYNRNCFINPAKIKAIWNTHFQNTLLSTREFEQRLVWIHKVGKDAVLDLYVNSLDKNLYTIDSMAARLLSGEMKARFLQFAARHDGKVKNGVRQLEMLRDYYQSKTLAYTEAITKTQNEFWQKQRELDAVASRKQSAYREKDMNRLSQNFGEELNLNMKEAYRQLGYDTIRPRILPTDVYAFRVVNTGWYNVDRAVVASTVNRSTLDFTDSATGKKAVIHYNPVSFLVTDWKSYDRLYVYLLPDKLNSFMRLEGTGGKYKDQLDELMKYNMICIGWKKEQAYLYGQNGLKPGDHAHVVLNAVSQEQFDKELDRIGSKAQISDVQDELSYFLFVVKDKERLKTMQEIKHLRERIYRFLNPCEIPME